MPVTTNLCWMKKTRMLHLWGLLTVTALWAVPVWAQPDAPDTDTRQLELEQLQAQLDVMHEEVNELHNYRICAEKGKVFKPQQTSRADADGCVSPQTLPPPSAGNQTPQTNAQAAEPNNSGREGNKPIAPTARTFTLPSAGEVQRDVPLNRLEGGVRTEKKPRQQTTADTAPETTSPRNQANQTSGQNPILGGIKPDYPNERTRRLIEKAVSQALDGNTPDPRSFADGNTPQQSSQSRQGRQQPQREQRQEAQRNAGQQGKQQNYQQAHRDAVKNLVPSCREGEFLTTVDGQVVCQRAASAGKMACPPSTLKVYLSRLDRHLHYHVSYTPHGQEQSATENNHKVTVTCNNGDYSLKTVTRMECGGRHCHPSRTPAYSLTYYCNQDDTGRCYAKQNGHLTNNNFIEARVSKQY